MVRALLVLSVLICVSLSYAETDPGYCGLFGIETGKHDPFYKSGACPDHDKETAANRDGHPYTTNSETALKFMGRTLYTGAAELAEGVYAGVTAVPYALIGGGVGFLMWIGRAAIRRRTDEKRS